MDEAPFVSIFYVTVIWESFSEQTALTLDILISAAFFRALTHPHHPFLPLKREAAALLHFGTFIRIFLSAVYLRFTLLPVIGSSWLIVLK